MLRNLSSVKSHNIATYSHTASTTQGVSDLALARRGLIHIRAVQTGDFCGIYQPFVNKMQTILL